MVVNQTSFLARLGVYLLAALVVVLLPTALWSDFISPLSRWDEWKNRDLPQSQQREPTKGIPRVVQVELSIFKAIVVPPTAISRALLDGSTAYGDMARQGSGHNFDPPGISALEWLKIGLPFWITVVTGVSEFVLFLRRRNA